MKKLFAILLLVVPFSVHGKIFAVLVGISEYEHNIENLSYGHRDAAEMFQLLKAYTTPDSMVLLTDQQATYDAIVHQTSQLFRQAKPEDIVIFFFSGHGYPNLFCVYDKNLYFSTLQKLFKACKANRKLIFADACFAGGLRQEGRQATSSLDNPNMGKNVMLFLASRSNQHAAESHTLRNGVFTYFLLAGLRGGADANKDRYITAIELFNFVHPKVKERSNGKQIPVMWGKFDKNMVILQLKINST